MTYLAIVQKIIFCDESNVDNPNKQHWVFEKDWQPVTPGYVLGFFSILLLCGAYGV